jgi:hypothetical protein
VVALSQAGDQRPSEDFQLISALSRLESMARTQQQSLQQDGFYGDHAHLLYLMSVLSFGVRPGSLIDRSC